MRVAIGIAKMRNKISIANNRKPFNGAPSDSEATELELNIMGVTAEIAVAKSLNKYWAPEFIDLLDYDIHPNIQVRATKYKTGNLIVNPKDNDHHKFYLVIVNGSEFNIVGWEYGGLCKKEEYYQNKGNGRPPTFFVPQEKLRTI